MAFRLTPHERGFYPLFTRAAENIAVAADELAKLVATDPAGRHTLAARVKEAELAGDEVTHEIMVKINTTFVTPFDREDIYRLGSGLDDVMDMMDEVVDLILLYEVKVLPPELSQQVEVIQRCAELTAAAMPRLQTPQDLEEYWIEINRLENAGDKNHRRTLANLFSGQYEALEVLKLKDIVESLEGAIDAFEKVANIVEQIAVKES
jgi:predicted phosphate transport protein (TIGR00153 family)